ncbi:MAG: single-stranded DNA-binding protein [Bacteroidales bacterium]|nr:single-stranded DNA-binding protein [Bacteroidales bacterium]
MEQLNRIELRGIVGNVKRQIISDKEMARINVATSRAYRDKSGAAVIETTWHNVVIWDVERIADVQALEKGAKVRVEGRVRTQKFTGADEIERTQYEVVATKVSAIENSDTLQYEMN